MIHEHELPQKLREAPLPEPVGGLDAARERAMGRVRHRFPADTARAPHWRRYRAPLGATLAVAGAALAFLLLQPGGAPDELPSAAQIQQLYDQHEQHQSTYFAAQAREPVE